MLRNVCLLYQLVEVLVPHVCRLIIEIFAHCDYDVIGGISERLIFDVAHKVINLIEFDMQNLNYCHSLNHAVNVASQNLISSFNLKHFFCNMSNGRE
jgi:hypothetical protein